MSKIEYDYTPLVCLPVVIDAPGKYRTRAGEIVTIDSTGFQGRYNSSGRYASGQFDRWHRSGRLFRSMLSGNDIIAKADND